MIDAPTPEPSPTAPASTSWRRHLATALGWLGFAVIVGLYAYRVHQYDAQTKGLVIDDVFIYLRYAQNFAQGHGLVYNPGEPVEGYTSFLWTFMLGVAGAVGLDLLDSARWLGAALGAATLWLTWRTAALLLPGLAQSASQETPAWATSPTPLLYTQGLALVAPLFLATNRTFTVWAMQGMEVKLFGLTAVMALWAWVRGGLKAEGPVRRWVSLFGISLGLAALTRPEGYLLAAVFGLTALVQAWRQGLWRGWGLAVAWGAAFVVPHMIFRLAYYGDIVPNTFYAKVNGAQWSQGWDWLKASFVTHHMSWYIGLVVIGVAATLAYSRHRAAAIGSALFTAVYLIYLMSVGGDYFEFRFLDVLMPIWALWALGAVNVLASMKDKPAALRVVGVLAAVSVLMAGNWLNVHAATPGRKHISTVEREQSFTRIFFEAGQWFAKNLGPGESLAIRPAGAIAYISGARCLDLLGLNDRDIATNPRFVTKGVAGHQRQVPREYAIERGITYWVDHPRISKRPVRQKNVVSVELRRGRWLSFEVLTEKSRWRPGVYLKGKGPDSPAPALKPPRKPAAKPPKGAQQPSTPPPGSNTNSPAPKTQVKPGPKAIKGPKKAPKTILNKPKLAPKAAPSPKKKP